MGVHVDRDQIVDVHGVIILAAFRARHEVITPVSGTINLWASEATGRPTARLVRAFRPAGGPGRSTRGAWPGTVPAAAQLLREGLELPPGITDPGRRERVGEVHRGRDAGRGVRARPAGRVHPGVVPAGPGAGDRAGRRGPAVRRARAGRARRRGRTSCGRTPCTRCTRYLEEHPGRSRRPERLHELSHGQGFLEILRTRVNQRGFYLMDEPDSPLSFVASLEPGGAAARPRRRASRRWSWRPTPPSSPRSPARTCSSSATGASAGRMGRPGDRAVLARSSSATPPVPPVPARRRGGRANRAQQTQRRPRSAVGGAAAAASRAAPAAVSQAAGAGPSGRPRVSASRARQAGWAVPPPPRMTRRGAWPAARRSSRRSRSRAATPSRALRMQVFAFVGEGEAGPGAGRARVPALRGQVGVEARRVRAGGAGGGVVELLPGHAEQVADPVEGDAHVLHRGQPVVAVADRAVQVGGGGGLRPRRRTGPTHWPPLPRVSIASSGRRPAA